MNAHDSSGRRVFIKGNRQVEIVERNIRSFWEKVEKSDGCWTWKAWKDKAGYGKIQVGKTYFLAHRFSFMLHGGTFPEGKTDVLHSCDNPSCVNPAHLRAGNDEDNSLDKILRGRIASGSRSGARTHPEKWKRGEDHRCSKLDERKVREIRKRRALGLGSLNEMAKEFGVSNATIDHAARGLTWKHIT
jgi:hypothetical protein